jgi:hypothetical protein
MLTGRIGRLTQARPRSQGFMLRIAALVLVIGASLAAASLVAASLAAGPAAAQFGNQPPPRPPGDIPNGGFPAQPRPPDQYPGQQQYPPPPPSAGPPPSGIQAQPLPPPPGAAAAPPPPPAQRARVNPPPANPPPAGAQPANPPPPQPADTSVQPDDTVVTETPTQKIPNNRAVFSGLDKITGRIISFDAAIGETVQFGALQVTARACYTRPPTEATNTDAFVDVDEVTLKGEIKRIFTGWMFASSPGLHAVEHPIYDVWLTDCSSPVPAPVAQSTTPSPAPVAPTPAPQRPRQPPAPRQVSPAPAPAAPR